MQPTRRERLSLATLWALTILMAIFVLGFFGFAAVSTASAQVPGKNGDLLIGISSSLESENVIAHPNRGGWSLKSIGAVDGESLNGTFAPDGKSIAFGGASSDFPQPMNPGIFEYELGNSSPELIWRTPDELGSRDALDYSPSGSSLLLTHFEADCDNRACEQFVTDPANGIYVRNLDLGMTTRLELRSRIYPLEAIYSPDGRRIAILSKDEPTAVMGGKSTVYMVSKDGSTPRKVFRSTNISGLSISPDGRRIAFGKKKATSDGFLTDIYMIKTDGSRLKRITSDGQSSNPVFSPDGERIAMNKTEPNFDEKVWISTLSGSESDLVSERGGDQTLLDWARARPFRVVRYKRSKGLLVVRTWGPGKVSVHGPVFAKRSRIARKSGVVRVPVSIKRGIRIKAGAKFKLKVRFAPKGALPSKLTRYLKLG